MVIRYRNRETDKLYSLNPNIASMRELRGILDNDLYILSNSTRKRAEACLQALIDKRIQECVS